MTNTKHNKSAPLLVLAQLFGNTINKDIKFKVPKPCLTCGKATTHNGGFCSTECHAMYMLGQKEMNSTLVTSKKKLGSFNFSHLSRAKRKVQKAKNLALQQYHLKRLSMALDNIGVLAK